MFEDKKFVIVILVFYYLSSVNCKESFFIQCDPAKASAEKSNTECPQNSQCVELGTKINTTSNDSVTISSYGGLCACKVNYTVNRNYSSESNSAQYCIELNKTTQTTVDAQQNVSTIATPVTIKITTAAPTSETLKSTLAPSPVKTTTTKKVEPTEKSHEESNESANKNDSKDKQPEKQQQQSNNNNNASPQTHILGGIVLPVMIVLAFLGVVYGIRKYDVLERTQNYIRNRRNGHTHQTRYDGLENDFDDDPLLI